jgi:hypothetical protein
MTRLPAIFCVAFLLVTAALAQEATQQSPQQDKTQAPSAPGTGGVTAPLGPPGPRFQVNLTDFEVFDETGWDFWASDEAVFIVKTPTYRVFTREFGSLDSDGTVHSFDQNARCAFPVVDSGLPDGRWSCDPNGAAAPISFLLQAWEQDFMWFDFCKEQDVGTDARTPSMELCADDILHHWIIGEAQVTLDLPTLVSQLPQPGQSFTRNAVLQGGCFAVDNPAACGPDEIEPRYNVTYTVTRIADSAGSGGGLVVEQ